MWPAPRSCFSDKQPCGGALRGAQGVKAQPRRKNVFRTTSKRPLPRAAAQVKTDRGDKPAEDIKILNIDVLDAVEDG